MDITPIIPAGRQVIDRYGPGGFRVSGTMFTGAVLVFPDATLVWPVLDMVGVTPESLRPVAERGAVEILLLGCGRRMQMVPRPVRDALRAIGIVIDAMDTGAACRTYNVLLSEGRRVAAALLPVGA